MPIDMHAFEDDDLDLRAVRDGRAAAGRATATSAAERERHLVAEARAEHARERAGDEHHQRAGQHQQAGAGGVEPEAVAGRRRRLGELRDQDERAEHAEADEQRREVRHQHGRLRERLDVGQRLRACAARARPRPRARRAPTRDQPERPRATPSPTRSPARSPSSGSDEPDARARPRRGRRRGRACGRATRGRTARCAIAAAQAA